MFKIKTIFNIILIHGLFITKSSASTDEASLVKYLLKDSNSNERPVENSSDPVNVSLSLALVNVLYLNVHETTSKLQTNIWVTMQWSDANMKWKPYEYGNISDIRIPIYRMWRPDILSFKSSSRSFVPMHQMDAVVKYDGSISYIAPGIFSTLCQMDFTRYPNDAHECDIKLGSWTLDVTKLNLQLKENADFSRYTEGSEWTLTGMPCQRNEVYREGFDKVFADITCRLQVKRQGDYIYAEYLSLNLVFYTILLLSFLTPPASWHKITLSFVSLLLPICIVDSFIEAIPHLYFVKSKLYYYYRYLFFLQFVGLILNFMSFHLFHKQETLPAWARTTLQSTYRSSILRFVVPSTYNFNQQKLKSIDETGNGPDLQPAGGHDQGSVEGDWTHVACILDRGSLILFVIILPVFHLTYFPFKN